MKGAQAHCFSLLAFIIHSDVSGEADLAPLVKKV